MHVRERFELFIQEPVDQRVFISGENTYRSMSHVHVTEYIMKICFWICFEVMPPYQGPKLKGDSLSP
jgi:hypothetical protein